MSSAWCNFKYPVVLAYFKFKKRTRISILEYKATRLKSKFGIDYLTLVGDGAPVRDLERCLGSTLEEFNVLDAEIKENNRLVEEKEKRTNEKLGVVIPPPPPKLVEKPQVVYRLPPPKNRRHHQAPRPRRPIRGRSPEKRKPQLATYINNHDIDGDSGHTHMCSFDGSIQSTDEPKETTKKKKPKRKGRRKKK